MASCENLNCKRVLVLYTGGTIGMKLNSRGKLESEPHYLVELMRNNSLLNDVNVSNHIRTNHQESEFTLPVDPGCEKIIYRIKEYSQLIDSSNISVEHWRLMASDIEENYDNFDGFVILHGTDTMAYTSSALSFMLENLDKPVILTGAQEPLWRARSDGVANAQQALLVAGGGELGMRGVGLLFGRRLLRGCCATKASLRALDSFSSPNARLLADFQVAVEVNEIPPEPKQELKVHTKMSDRVGVLFFHPGISVDVVKTTLDAYDGVVLVTYGTGNICSDSEGIVEALKTAVWKEKLLVAVSAAAEGRLGGKYASGVQNAVPGVLLGGGLTLEAAFAKLSFVLAQKVSVKEKKQKMLTDICGEMATESYRSCL